MSSKSVVIALSIVLITAGLSVAEIPQVISYQGKVTDLGGVPVPDGTYTLRFRIYDDQTGGTLEWDSDDVSTPVSDGVFNVILGESPQPAVSLPFDDDYWLLVTVEGDDQIPRKRLGSTGYAFMASGLVPGTEVRGSVTSGSDAAISAVNTAATEPTFGLYGASASVSGRGVYGTAFATTGVTSGVSGRSYSTEGSGVYGYASAITGTTWGVRGTATSEEGTGVHGEVSGSSGTNYGVFGKTWSTAGYAVYGRNEAGGGTYGYLGSGDYGAYGRYDQFDYGYLGGSGIGVRGVSGTGIGVRGSVSGGGGIGVSGGTMDGTGVYGCNYPMGSVTPHYGVYGIMHGGGYGFGVYYSGGLAGTGGKSCIVETSRGARLLYCQESPECWFEDFGEGHLVNGSSHVELDPLFLETVTVDATNPMKVFVQLGGPCEGVYVQKGLTGFEVLELHEGGSNVTFDYRVVAKRKGFEQKRLDYCKAGETDPYLHAELREKGPQ